MERLATPSWCSQDGFDLGIQGPLKDRWRARQTAVAWWECDIGMWHGTSLPNLSLFFGDRCLNLSFLQVLMDQFLKKKDAYPTLMDQFLSSWASAIQQLCRNFAVCPSALMSPQYLGRNLWNATALGTDEDQEMSSRSSTRGLQLTLMIVQVIKWMTFPYSSSNMQSTLDPTSATLPKQVDYFNSAVCNFKVPKFHSQNISAHIDWPGVRLLSFFRFSITKVCLLRIANQDHPILSIITDPYLWELKPSPVASG